MKKLLLIINPTAGKEKAKRFLPWMIDFFEQKGFLVDVFQTQKSLDALKRSQKARNKYAMVVVCGGDGTINEAMNGLAKSSTVLGIVPFGTGNVLAKELKIPRNFKQACKKIVYGKIKKIDLGLVKATPTAEDKKRGLVEGIIRRRVIRYFVLMAGIGFDAHVAQTVEKDKMKLKKLLGCATYSLAAFQQFFKYKKRKLMIKVKDEKGRYQKTKGYFVVVGNEKYYGNTLQLTHKADLTDGFIDVLIMKRMSFVDVCKCVFLGSTIKKHEFLKDIEYYKTKKIKIDTEGKTPVIMHVDCEIIGQTPVKVEVVPKALRIVC